MLRVFVVGLLAALGGCSSGDKTVRINGKVTAGGEPAVGATVKLHPRGGQPLTHTPQGEVGDDGTFVVSTYQPGDGVPPGTYKVCVTWRERKRSFGEVRETGPDRFGGAYSDPEKTPLEVTVAANSPDVVLDLPAPKEKPAKK